MGVGWELHWGGGGAWCLDVGKWWGYYVCAIRDVRPKLGIQGTEEGEGVKA